MTLNNGVNCSSCMTRPRRQKFFPERTLERRIVQHLLGQQLLQPPVVLQRLSSLRASDTSSRQILPSICRRSSRSSLCRRHSSSDLAPASCSFNIPMICSSAKRLVHRRSPRDRLNYQMERNPGSRSETIPNIELVRAGSGHPKFEILLITTLSPSVTTSQKWV